ncbi:unnamed protein product [Cuscuta epithymum]|uniref:Uncharacterized protein n=1 Tax=Cuscuta epithymum TaxID=186058 RepID=A0AAV0EML5_9ASTE|nr:unnamed protein product [Cuscuta epithymum]
MPLFHMGNPQNFVGTFATGHCLFPCKNVVVPSVRLTCAEYESQALARTPEYRIMGDIWNMESFPSGKKFAYEKELNPLIPIIQMSGLVGGGGSSGGPVFNTNQELVGMLVMGADGFEIAIHVSMLKQFLKDAAENSKIGHDDEAGSSKKPKTGSSKKLQRWGHNI